MKKLAIAKLIGALFLMSLLPAQAQQADAGGEINLRFLANEDGTRTEFHKLGDPRTLIKKTRDKAGTLVSVAVYRLDTGGNQVSAEIFDAKKTKLYDVIYGYDKTTGRMVEEQIWDARVKRISKETGKETPVRRFIYSHDAQGRQQRPVSLTLIPGAIVDIPGVINSATAIPEGIFDEE